MVRGPAFAYGAQKALLKKSGLSNIIVLQIPPKRSGTKQRGRGSGSVDLRSIYIANGVGIFALLMLLYTSHAKTLRRGLEDKLYTFLIFGVMLGCFMEAFSYTLDGRVFPGARLLNYAANTYLYSVNLLLPFCLLVYVDLGLYGDPGRIWKHYKPQIIVGLVMFGINLVNFFIPVSYYITAQNVYERRPLSYVYYFVILYYCVSGMVLRRRFEKENGTGAFFNINMFLVPILIGAGLQFLFYGLSMAWISAALGMVGMSMMQQNETAYIDSLVDTYNRQYMNHILASWSSRGRSFAGVMLDLDGFKRINDQYGHSEGDKALKTVTDILKSARLDNEWVFRFAGDEFIVLKLTRSPDGLAAYMDEVNRRLSAYNNGERPYRLVLSYGMSFFDDGDIDAFMREMDENMYRMKAEHHRPC